MYEWSQILSLWSLRNISPRMYEFSFVYILRDLRARIRISESQHLSFFRPISSEQQCVIREQNKYLNWEI